MLRKNTRYPKLFRASHQFGLESSKTSNSSPWKKRILFLSKLNWNLVGQNETLRHRTEKFTSARERSPSSAFSNVNIATTLKVSFFLSWGFFGGGMGGNFFCFFSGEVAPDWKGKPFVSSNFPQKTMTTKYWFNHPNKGTRQENRSTHHH